MGFEWQTDDEQAQTPVWREEKRSRRVHTPRWRWYLLLLIAAVAAVAYLWRLADQRVEASMERARADVRVSQELVERAAAASDVEMIRTVLSGRDEDWTGAQRDLVEAGNGYTGIARLLSLAPAGAADEMSLTFDPALRTAELVVAQPYTPLAATGGDPAILEQTFVFRRGSNRWLLAPPDDEFWGQQHSLRTSLGSFHYPERDRELARDLALDLERDVRAYCDRVGESCPDDLQLVITFDPDVESLAHFQDGREMLRSGSDVTLPAPTLLGRPQNDAGYEALHSAYARYVLAAVAPRITGWECCEHVLFWQALLQAALHEMNLTGPLLPPQETVAAMEYVAYGDGYFQELSRYWQVQTPAPATEPLPLEVRTFVAFLLDVPPSSAPSGAPSVNDLEAALAASPSLGRWWSSVTRFQAQEQVVVQRELARFLQARYEAPPLPAGLALPDADLLLVCRTEGARVWRYDLHAESWTAEMELPRDEVFALLSYGDSYFVSALRYTAEGESPAFRLLEKRPGTPATEVAAESGAIWVPLVKHGDTIPVVILSLAEEGSEQQPDLAMLDLASCRAGQCAWEITPGIISAAPGGQYELAFSLAGLGASEVFLRERGADWQQVAEGAFPVWLDGETFAYLQEDQSPGYRRVLVQDVTGASAVLFDSDPQTGTLVDGMTVRIVRAATSPAAPDTLFLVAAAGNEFPAVYVLAVSRPAGGTWFVEEPVVPEVVEQTTGSSQFSVVPDATTGRWLLTSLAGTGMQPVMTYWLVDAAGEHPPLELRGSADSWILSSYDWSPDGQWLAWPVAGGASVMAPAYRNGGEPYRLFVPAEQADCAMAAWVERN